MSCGSGTRERQVICSDRERNLYPVDQCNAHPKPSTVERCNTQPCYSPQGEHMQHELLNQASCSRRIFSHALLLSFFFYTVLQECTCKISSCLQCIVLHSCNVMYRYFSLPLFLSLFNETKCSFHCFYIPGPCSSIFRKIL